MPSIILRNKTQFHLRDKKIEMEIPGTLMRTLVEVCDGNTQMQAIEDDLKNTWDITLIRKLVNELSDLGIIGIANNLGNAIWGAVENPSVFPNELSEKHIAVLVVKAGLRHKKNQPRSVEKTSETNFAKLLNSRQSVRSFTNDTVAFQSIVTMLWSAYGQLQSGSRTTPSAGALYPLRLTLGLMRQTGKLELGVYDIWLGLPGKVGFRLISSDIQKFMRSFVDPEMVEQSNGVIVVSGSFDISAEKYSNRSMLFVTLEAGHVAQNIHLAASELKIGTVEIGGFFDSLLAECLYLPDGYRPLTTVIFGKENKMQIQEQHRRMEFHWMNPATEKYQLPFAMAVARVSVEGNNTWSSGKASSPKLAHIKAKSEAKEWAACGCIPRLTFDSFENMTNVVDPRSIVAFHPYQYRSKSFPFALFDPSKKYGWTIGQNEMTMSKVSVLADCVYFPYYPKTQHYAHASSSGVAAHPNRLAAIQNGTLELVERDSFMIAYLAKLNLPTIVDRTLPEFIQVRIQALRAVGFDIHVKDYSLDLAPVVFVFAQNKNMSYTTCAASCNFDIEEALDHALMEVEASVYQRFVNGAPASMHPDSVQFPNQHGELYEQKKFFQKANFLIKSNHHIPFKNTGKGTAETWTQLLNIFNEKSWPLITVPMKLKAVLGGSDGLHIIRSIVPGMIPISFGSDLEPLGMKRLYEQALLRNKRVLHYADIPSFPHPFA